MNPIKWARQKLSFKIKPWRSRPKNQRALIITTLIFFGIPTFFILWAALPKAVTSALLVIALLSLVFGAIYGCVRCFMDGGSGRP